MLRLTDESEYGKPEPSAELKLAELGDIEADANSGEMQMVPPSSDLNDVEETNGQDASKAKKK